MDHLHAQRHIIVKLKIAMINTRETFQARETVQTPNLFNVFRPRGWRRYRGEKLISSSLLTCKKTSSGSRILGANNEHRKDTNCISRMQSFAKSLRACKPEDVRSTRVRGYIGLVTFKRHFPKSYRQPGDYISAPSRQAARCRTMNPTLLPVGTTR